MATYENISPDDLRRVLAEVEGKKPTQRLMAAINYLADDDLTQKEVAERYGYTGGWLSRWLDRFITDFALVAEDVFITLVHELAEQVPLGKFYRIDGTDIPADQQDDDAEWNYDHAEDDFYHGYGCCLVTAADNIPVAATFTPAKKVDQETAMRVTGDALAIKKPIWMLGDAEFDMLDWHDRLLEQGIVPVVPYNQRNATDPLDIEYRIEDTIAVSEERLERPIESGHGSRQRLASARISASGPQSDQRNV